VDEDHLDHYGTRENLEKAFVQFMNNVPFYGVNFVCGDDPGVRALVSQVKRPVVTYGMGEGCMLRAVPLEIGAVNRFEVWKEGTKLGVAELPQPGRHNILNALAAIGVAIACDIPFEAIQKGLAGFGGVGRRFEFKGERDGVTVIDDYGHHPREIQATLDTARRVFPDRRIVVAFQPHRFTRTQAHFAEFCKLFDSVGEVLLTEIYAASEKPIPGINGQNLAQGMRQVSSTPVTFYQTVPELVQGLEEKLKPGDVLMTIGAGSITKAGPAWLEGRRNA